MPSREIVNSVPRRITKTQSGTHQALKNTSYESLIASWLMQDGWQVFLPVLDHGHKTDLLISDGPQFFRIQVKSFLNRGKSQQIQNSWAPNKIDYVVFFARNGGWGVIVPAFEERQRKLKHEEHRRFQPSRRDFLKQFHLI